MTHCPSDPAEAENQRNLYLVVGFVVVNWALAEQALDGAVAVLYGCPDSKAFAKKGLPSSLQAKLKFIRDATSNVARWAALRNEAASLADRLDTFGKKRHRFAHDAIRFPGFRGGRIEFSSLRPQNDIHRLTVWEFDGTTFPKLAEELGTLVSDTAKFANRLIDMDKRP